MDLSTKLALETDPENFREGPVQPEVSAGDVIGDWDMAENEERWGFTTRAASFEEIYEGNLSLASEKWTEMIIMAAIAALSAFFVVPLRLDMRSTWQRRTITTVLFVIGLVVTATLLMISYFFGLIAGLSAELWFLCVLAGACPIWLIAWMIKWLSSRVDLPAA